eukprot:2129737-Prymnesium_polylepis.1
MPRAAVRTSSDKSSTCRVTVRRERPSAPPGNTVMRFENEVQSPQSKVVDLSQPHLTCSDSPGNHPIHPPLSRVGLGSLGVADSPQA